MTQEQLEERGYRRHVAGGVVFQHADFFMQRKVTDPDGIRYFIEFVHYPSTHGLSTEAWTCHLNINEPHCTFEQHRPTDLDDAETRCHDVWDLLGRPYYERYEEART